MNDTQTTTNKDLTHTIYVQAIHFSFVVLRALSHYTYDWIRTLRQRATNCKRLDVVKKYVMQPELH